MGRLLTVLGFAILAAAPPLSPLAASAAEARAIVSPCQITAEAESLLSFTVSADGGTILYSLTREIGSDLWLRNADPAAFTPPQRLTDDVAEEREPDLAADGRLLTYTGTAHDVKGDIYLLDLADRAKPPVRLTGREGEEGSPRFSPDGTKIYFHTRAQAGAPWQLAVADRASGRVEPLATGGDAASPAPSPDGSKLAFASSRSDAKGADIYYLDLASGQVVQVTFGPAIDLAPRWSPDSKEIFFARINLDTNRDGAVTREDRAAIFHTRLAEGSATYPLTPYSYSAHSPLVRGAYLYFLANQGSIDNCWRLPTTGQIPVTGDAKSQLELAHRLDHQIPARPDEAILGYLQVADRHGRDRAARARALYQAGLLFKEEGYLKVALELFGAICPEPTARCEEPHSSLARIEAIVITARLEEEAGRPEAREEAIAALTPLAASPESRIALVAVIEKVRLETHGSPAPGRVMAAMAELDLALAAHGTVRDKAAEATLMKADLFSRFNPPAATYPLFQKVLRAFADQEEWSDLAAARIVDLLLADTATSDRAMRIAALRRIAEENKVALPRIAMTALNRLADIYYQMDESAKAKQLYFQLIDTFPGVSTQSGAARLALAEILYQEQRFREALDLYQAEIDARPEADSIWMLARQGYIQKSLAEAEYLFRLGEVTGAKKIFKELIDYDPTIVEAHRGLIKSAAALGTIAETVAHYQALAGQAPSDPIAIYGTALSLTYLNTEESARRAMELLAQAITIRGDSEYFRQTAGYVFEVLETVYGQKGMLEQALDEYRKAFSLNSRTANRANRANLLLNLGNTNYLLGRYEQAFSYFTRRAAEPEPFSDPNTEILFFRRLGHSAYQSRDTGEAIKAFSQTMTLLNRTMDPLKSVATFDRLNSFVSGRVLTPAQTILQDQASRRSLLAEAMELAEQEAELKEAVARAASGTPPPESAAWHGFKEQLQTLYRQQALLNRKVVELAKSFQNDPQAAMLPPPEEVSATLKLYGDKLEQDLLFPERLLEFKAEIADRLGLALQDTGRWEEAARSFGEAYDLNQALGRTANLAAKKRAVAYALYMAAGQVSGRRHDELLTRAKGEFEKALALVGQYGVAARPEPKKEGLINIALAVELDKSDVTQAAHGFSAQQEIRLDEAFLMRINLEQGQIEAAWQALAGQIAQYPEGKEVATRDTFGVSLLFHRAGQLAVARNALSEAFDLFARSANLCLDLGTPVSAMVNLRNLASLLTRMEQPLSADRFGELIDLDGRTARLLAAKAGQMPDRNQATFHNDLGCGYLSLALAPQESLTGQALAMEAGRRAMAHFSRGLDLLGAKAAAPSRELLALTASLNYNLGRLCQHLGEKVQAETRLDQAATLARQGLLADIGWRALAALGRYDEALAELRRMTFTRARAGKGEVVAAFMQRVMELAANNKAEAGFNLLAELAEIERFQRLAPLVFTLSREEERAILDLLPRLRNIADLKREAETAKGPDKPYLEEKLGLEMTILKGQHQELVTLLPAMVRNRLGTAMAEDLLLLIGSALEGERLANEAVAASPEAAKPLHSRYLSLVDQYQRMQERLATTQEGKTLAALFGPEPVEAMEVMEAMAEGECLLQMVETGSAGARYLAFAVGRESLTAKPVNGVAEARPQNCSAPVLVADDPALFREIPADSFSFSTSQFLRSVASKKPFTKKLLVLHSGEEAPKALAAQAKDLEAVFAPLSADPAAPPSRANLLLLADQVGSLYQVPTRGGESGRFQPGIRTEAGGQLPLDRALAEAGNLTAAILPNAAATDAYEAANLLTLSGVPTILLPLVAGAAPEMVPAILNTIRNESPAMALAAAAPAHDPQKSWLVLGYRGMDAMEAQELGRQQFTDFVRRGRALFEATQPAQALTPFANAIDFAEQAADFSQYLPPLYDYARECAFLSGDLKKAAEYAAKSVALLARTEPDTDKHAEALLRLGLLESRTEAFDQAIGHLEEAQDIFTNLESPEGALQAMNNLGLVLENATAYDRALHLFMDAAALSQQLAKGRFTGQQYSNIGRVYDLRLNNFAKASEYYAKGAALFAQAGDHKEEAVAQLNIGRCARLLGDFQEAEARYSRALDLASSLTLPAKESADLKGRILLEQANNHWYQARYDQALRLDNEVLDLAAASDLPPLAIMARNTAGLILWTLGQPQKALVELERALTMAKSLANRPDEVSTTLNNLGLVYRELGQLDQALVHLEEALAIDTRLGSKWALAYDLRNKGQVLLKKGEVKAAIPLFRQAADYAAGIGNRINEAKCALWLATALEEDGQDEESGRAFAQARTLARSMALKEVEWRAIFGLARRQLAQKNSDGAKGLLLECMDLVESMRAEIRIEQLRDSFISDKLDAYETLVALLVERGETGEAFAVAERSRARNFIDLLGNQRLTLDNTVDQALYDNWRQLKSKVEEHETLLAQATEEEAQKVYAGALSRLKNDLDSAMVKIQLANPQLSSLVSVQTISLARLQELTEPGTAFLSYYFAKDELFCWLIKKESVRLQRLPLSKLALGEFILDYRRRTQNLEPVTEMAAKLYQWLVAPLAADLAGEERLCIIPHGPLHYLSFATLFDGKDYLIDRYPLFYLPSGSVFEHTVARRQPLADKSRLKVLAIGNPDLGDPLFALPFAEHEVGTIHWNFPEVTVLTGKYATEKWLVENIGRFNVIHLASHGEFDPVNPLASALKLAGQREYDGDLRADEVLSLTINPDLVVLSACQTGLAKVTSGDDVIGLNRAFFYAGTHAMISSLWRVSDIATAVEVKHFYRMYPNNSKADSLRLAMLHVKNRFPHPGYWGAFTLVGDYQ